MHRALMLAWMAHISDPSTLASEVADSELKAHLCYREGKHLKSKKHLYNSFFLKSTVYIQYLMIASSVERKRRHMSLQ